MRLKALLMVFSITGCGCSVVQRPDVDLCIINSVEENRSCLNMKRDYNDDGTVLPGAKLFQKPNKVLMDLNKALVIDSSSGFEDGIANLKIYINQLREAAKTNNPDPVQEP